MNAFRISFALAALSLVACNKNVSEPQRAPAANSAPAVAVSAAAPKPATPAAAPAAETVGLDWTVPATWTLGPARPMRKATYLVPAAKGDAAGGELAISYFGAGQGGDVEANIQRWVGQFKDVAEGAVKRSEKTVGDLKASIVEVPSGTYVNMMGGPHAGMAGAESKDFALLGAIVEAPSGKYFFKLTGPKATVEASHKDFDAIIDGLKVK
ncbi:MAG TPA: hypothetical protein VHM70_30185 [Polyangiaceae bacterium]|jgi:hypothetical protein|nr:hypothetical protein [Polyangiaceae bacterium]